MGSVLVNISPANIFSTMFLPERFCQNRQAASGRSEH